ncbi:C45 family peptidase, partial [Tyzzerella sp. OttesenSCG-928-J15]|nr:C45 family peptidase [Tyzzerella sp. OttesenSCG-928-J15]
VKFLEDVPHDVPNQFGLADKQGNLVCVECFPNKVYVNREKEYFVHTNHNVYALEEPECTVGKTTRDRFAVMKELIEANKGNIDAEMAKDFLKCHDRSPNCICVHPCAERPWSKTLSAMVYELDSGVMNIAFGNPCETAYTAFKFDNYEI